MQWKKLPNLDANQAFLSRVFKEDIDPCLEFPNTELGSRVKEAVIQNTLCLDPVKVGLKLNIERTNFVLYFLKSNEMSKFGIFEHFYKK